MPPLMPKFEKAGGRGWLGFKKETVWTSAVTKWNRMESPAWIQNSFGRKAKAGCFKSRAWAPTVPVHSVAEAAPVAAAEIRAAAATAAARLEMS
jgi:hypothetical protein